MESTRPDILDKAYNFAVGEKGIYGAAALGLSGIAFAVFGTFAILEKYNLPDSTENANLTITLDNSRLNP
ncbi:MAG: hypothetical protein AAF988_05505 [Pseudomonadota bacterium]